MILGPLRNGADASQFNEKRSEYIKNNINSWRSPFKLTPDKEPTTEQFEWQIEHKWDQIFT